MGGSKKRGGKIAKYSEGNEERVRDEVSGSAGRRVLVERQ